MGMYPFTLQAYPGDPPDAALSVYGGLTSQASWLTVHFTVTGMQNHLLLPPPSLCPGRQDGLWQQTCFELFLAPVGSLAYWEINVSPSGNWNTYRFDAYRQSMQPEPILQVSQITPSSQLPDTFTLAYQVDMSILLTTYPRTQGVLECSPCCILVAAPQQKSYWALQHQPPRPDFHRRASFTLRVTPGLPTA